MNRDFFYNSLSTSLSSLLKHNGQFYLSVHWEMLTMVLLYQLKGFQLTMKPNTFKEPCWPNTFEIQYLPNTFELQYLPNTFETQYLPNTFEEQQYVPIASKAFQVHFHLAQFTYLPLTGGETASSEDTCASFAHFRAASRMTTEEDCTFQGTLLHKICSWKLWNTWRESFKRETKKEAWNDLDH